MFCEKCGAQVENDSKFCLNCGAPVTPQSAPVAVAAPAGPSALAKFFSNKKNVTITAAIAAAVVVAIVVICIIAGLPKPIYLDDYMIIEYEGLSGMGTAYMDMDTEALMAALKEHMSEQDMEVMMARLANAKKGLTFELGKTEELSNGDKIPLILEVDNDICKDYDIEFKLRNDTITVTGLRESKSLDLFADLVITYSGFAPNAWVRVESNSTNEFIQNYVSYSVSDGYDLEDGDTFTIEAYFSEYDAIEQGYLIKETSKTYTAANVPALQELDLFSHIEVSFEGCAPYANPVITVTSDNEFVKNCVYFYVNGGNFSEGDKFTVEASFSQYDAESYGYIINTSSKEYTATNLPQPVELNVFDYVKVIFTGIEGDGKATYELTTDDEFIKYYIDFEFNKSTSLSAGENIALIYSVRYGMDPLSYGYVLTENTSQGYVVPTLGQKLTDFNQFSAEEQAKLLDYVKTQAEGYLTKEGATASGMTLYNTGYSFGNELKNATSLSNLKVDSVVLGTESSWFISTDYMVFIVTVDIAGHPNLPATNGSATGYFYFYLANPIVKADGTLENSLDSLYRANYCYKSYEDLCSFYLNDINNQVVYNPNT